MLSGDDNKLASYAVGFKKGNEELRDKVQDTLDEMVKDGTFDRDCRKVGTYRQCLPRKIMLYHKT